MNLSHVIDSMLFKYDKHLLPDADGVNVTMEIHIQEISSIYELTADFELDLMYSEIWIDPRLSFTNLSICASNITLKSNFRDRLWTPDTCIINSKNAEIHKSPSENTFVIVYENGKYWESNSRLLIILAGSVLIISQLDTNTPNFKDDTNINVQGITGIEPLTFFIGVH